MNVLQIVFPGQVGGLLRVVEALATGLCRRGHRVTVCGIVTPNFPTPPLLTALRAAKVEVHSIAVSGRGYLHERRAVAALCRRVEPQVVHTHGYRPDVVDAGPARRAGIPVVSTAHGFAGGGFRNRLYERLQRRALRRFDAVVAVSRMLAEQLRHAGVPASRLHVVPNSSWASRPPCPREAARRALGLSVTGVPHIVWVGRLSREKGPDIFALALAHLKDLAWHASVIGDGPAHADLLATIKGAGLASRVTLHGVVPEAGSLMSAFDLFVLSSRTEGTPIVLFEAAAADVPIVTTAVGGVPDVVTPGEALLVPPGDPVALAEAMRSVLVERAAAMRRAEAARARIAARFGVEPWLDAYEAIYRAVSTGR